LKFILFSCRIKKILILHQMWYQYPQLYYSNKCTINIRSIIICNLYTNNIFKSPVSWSMAAWIVTKSLISPSKYKIFATPIGWLTIII